MLLFYYAIIDTPDAGYEAYYVAYAAIWRAICLRLRYDDVYISCRHATAFARAALMMLPREIASLCIHVLHFATPLRHAALQQLMVVI